VRDYINAAREMTPSPVAVVATPRLLRLHQQRHGRLAAAAAKTRGDADTFGTDFSAIFGGSATTISDGDKFQQHLTSAALCKLRGAWATTHIGSSSKEPIDGRGRQRSLRGTRATLHLGRRPATTRCEATPARTALTEAPAPTPPDYSTYTTAASSYDRRVELVCSRGENRLL